MVAYVLYQKNSKMEHEAEEFIKRLDRLRVRYELVEAESPRGISLTRLYDLPSRPAIVVAREDGTMVERWQHSWPLPEEVSYFAHT